MIFGAHIWIVNFFFFFSESNFFKLHYFLSNIKDLVATKMAIAMVKLSRTFFFGNIANRDVIHTRELTGFSSYQRDSLGYRVLPSVSLIRRFFLPFFFLRSQSERLVFGSGENG